MQIDINSGILLIGIVQGLFLSITIGMHKEGARKANRFLIALLLSFVLALVTHFLNMTDIWREYLVFFLLFSTSVFLFGPFLFLYVRSLTGYYQISIWNWFHGIPWLINLLMFIPILFVSENEVIQLIEHGLQQKFTVNLIPFLKMLSVSGYTMYSLFLIFQHQKAIKDKFSVLDKIDLSWLKGLVVSFLAIESIFVFAYLFDFRFDSIPGSIDTIFSLIVVFIIFMTGYKGLRQPEIFKAEDENINQNTMKYKSTNINQEQSRLIQQSLKQLMIHEQLYLDRFLDLGTLSTKVGVTTHQLSQCLNNDLKTSFYDYVNQLRVTDSKQRLINSDSSILDIALEVGFNNKATFNKSFKKHTSMTPSQYRKENN